jgi:hypothetical protein
LVLQTPAIQKNRYWSIQFVDLYAWNFAYAGTRTTGNDEGRILLAGPNWKGDTPKGITTVIRSDTDFVLAGYPLAPNETCVPQDDSESASAKMVQVITDRTVPPA